jgi:hypothetical protein
MDSSLLDNDWLHRGQAFIGYQTTLVFIYVFFGIRNEEEEEDEIGLGKYG